ncbi:Ff.00g067080.m01.CDS01 [Fusarium sp. VM40]|nr:Ff.00g067080.m01.CDS01 [Fusarium sp. VM40]
MSQTSLVESSSSGDTPRNALSLRLETPFVPEGSTHTTKQSFNIKGHYVYETTATPATPTYHIATLRRIGAATGNDAFIRYEDDMTLYSGEKMNIPFSLGVGLGPTPLIVIRGQKRGTIQGSIVMEKSGRSSKFYHMVPIKRALTKVEEDRMQALMHKRGYRDSDDWKKKLLLTVQERPTKELEWIDEYGSVVAVEKDANLEFPGEIQMEKKDLVVACWACRGFVLDKAA